ncbi:CD209 antigen-like protein A [Aplochiton taeniatus]
MAVYFLSVSGMNVYGSLAISISKLADYRGCVLTPENLTVGAEEVSWTDAIQYCRNLGLELISLGDNQLQQQLAPGLKASLKEKGLKLWIGLRRSSLTGEWYWLNKAVLGTTLWADGEPGGRLEGQCAMMRLGPDNQLSWSDQSCCEDAHPVCYKDPILFNMN